MRYAWRARAIFLAGALTSAGLLPAQDAVTPTGVTPSLAIASPVTAVTDDGSADALINSAAAVAVPDDPAVTTAVAATPRGLLSADEVTARNRAIGKTPPATQLRDVGHLAPLYAAYMTEIYCRKPAAQAALKTDQAGCGAYTLEALIPICASVWRSRLPRPDGLETADRPGYLKFIAGFQACLEQARRGLAQPGTASAGVAP